MAHSHQDDHGHHETAHDLDDRVPTDGALADEPSLVSLLGEMDLPANARVYGTEFTALNNSGVSGSALVFRDGNTLTVSVQAEGLEPDQMHLQHIHGNLTEDDSFTPTIRNDVDGDGFVELAEGIPSYGPVLLNLALDAEAATEVPIGGMAAGPLAFPMADEDGTLGYVRSFTFETEGEANRAEALLFDELTPVDKREVVLHGLSLAEGQGEKGGPGPDEADGTAGYKALLPVASGELSRITAMEDLADYRDHFCDENGVQCDIPGDLAFIM
jgi:hypothetical protein